MRYSKWFVGFVALVMTTSLWTAFAQDTPSVDEIVKKTNHMAYYQGKDGRAQVKMTITDSQGRTRQKSFTILRRNRDDKDEEQALYVFFHEPPDERGTVFMVHKHVGKDDDRWLYLPALDVVKRIAASDKRTSFVGSHFFYEDVSGRGIDQDNHELVETTDKYYVLKNTPKDPASVEFDSFTMYIHKQTFIPVQIKFEKNGEVYREATTLEVKDIQGYKTVTKGVMKDLRNGGQTLLEYSDVKYDMGLPDDIFTERYLRSAPQDYLK